MIDTKKLREFSNDIGYLHGSGPEMRLWLHNCADELDRVTAERDALKVDAESYRYLRANAADSYMWDDESINAAIRASKGEK